MKNVNFINIIFISIVISGFNGCGTSDSKSLSNTNTDIIKELPVDKSILPPISNSSEDTSPEELPIDKSILPPISNSSEDTSPEELPIDKSILPPVK